MRRLLRAMFSQVAVVGLALVLQILLMYASIMRISEYFFYVDVGLRIISIVTVVIIINRHSNPSYKLAWVVPILLFPLFGGLFYLFITGQMHTKYFFFKLSGLEKDINKNYPQDQVLLDEIAHKHPHRESTVRYINNVSGLAAYRCIHAQYFPVGEDKFKSVICELEKAQKYIFLEYFIIKEGKMWNTILDILKRKVCEGVDVRVMYDGMGSMTLLPKNYPQTLESYGIKCCVFSPFTPFLSALQNNRDHRKILVIDGKVAYTGGINMSDEYINIDYPYGHWKDMAVMVKGPAAFSFARMFLHLWWHTTKKGEDIKLFEPEFSKEELLAKEQSQGYVMPYADMPQDKYQIGEHIYMDIINKAKKYVYIATPYLILDHKMMTALTNAALSGIDVRIICPLIADHWYARAVAYSYYKELLDSGVKLYEYTPGFIHGKVFCCDDEIAVVGSINLDYRSLYLHFECAAWFLDCPIVHSVLTDFNDTLKKCRVITSDSCTKMNPFRKVLNALLRLFAPLM
ncbi:MAG: cardiolipin synthase [Clostridia bacterium]|nr:cardiolipin synthase [Clostridia bacterium]